MNPLKKLFGGKEKKGELQKPEEKKTLTDLELICGDEKEVYEALSEAMLLHPRRKTESMEEAARAAEKFKEAGDIRNAVMWFRVAGGLAIYKGNVEKVRKFFTECQQLSGEPYPIIKIAKKAVQKAQEYYQKYLKEE